MLRELVFLNRGVQAVKPKKEEEATAPPPPLNQDERRNANAIFAQFFPIKNEKDKIVVEERLLDKTFVAVVVSLIRNKLKASHKLSATSAETKKLHWYFIVILNELTNSKNT